MIFTSLAFVIFFFIVYGLYLLLRTRRDRHIWLLLSSSLFYGWWDWRYLGLMWAVIFVSYFTALLMQARPSRKRLIIGVAIAVQLLLLSVFKYTNFLIQSFTSLAAMLGIHLQASPLAILLPVGISFYIFHGISYIVDVYRGVIPAHKNLAHVAIYISYFPQLVAGPIVRASDFMPQLDRDVVIDHAKITRGLIELTTGLIYKSAFADNLARIADPILSNLGQYDNLSLVLGAFAFYGQIYFDFAGYSLMAIGLARMMGYNFPENFNHPYKAVNITDFWHRWHISLSTWLRNYLYIPLGGNRHGARKQYRNLFLTMLLGGLWHGASWNFVLWGGLHGVALAVHKRFGIKEPPASRVKRVPLFLVSWCVTQFFVLLCWVPFRLPEFRQTLEVFSAFAGLRDDAKLQAAVINIWLLFLPIIIDTVLPKLEFKTATEAAGTAPNRARTICICLLAGLILALALTMIPLNVSPFIYFQF